MKTQKMIATSHSVERFTELLNKELENGWMFVKTSMFMDQGRYAAIIEKDEVEPPKTTR